MADIRETMIKDWEDFSSWLKVAAKPNWRFRGVSSAEYELVPRVGRSNVFRHGYHPFIEEHMFNEFRRMAYAVLPQEHSAPSDWTLLILAQHHDLPTRLLDWTESPLVAAFFAVEDDASTKDAAIYAYVVQHEQFTNSDINPMNIEQVTAIRPPQISRRVVVQRAIFTIHPNPTEPFWPSPLYKTVIEGKFREELKARISQHGIDRASLFPDLDGLTRHLRWFYAHGMVIKQRRTIVPRASA